MTDMTLDQVPEEKVFRHVLLIGDSKTGKSTWAAQAALDGYLVIYIDSDNGISALKFLLRNHPEAMKRVLYLPTGSPYTFIDGLLNNSVFRWNMTQDKEYSSGMAKPTDKMIQIYPSRIPETAIVNIDSWTTVAMDAMELGADRLKVDLAEMTGTANQQGVYGDAGMKLTLLCAILQHAKFHIIVQAHGVTYEKYDKPLGSQESVKQKQMILREIIDVPVSSSRPHGQTMVKYFNEIGWLKIGRDDRATLSFKRVYGRVGGGTPNTEGPANDMSFAKCFGPVPPFPGIDSSWFVSMTSEEFVASRAANQSQSKPAGVSEAGVVTAKPANPMMASLLKK